MHAAETVTAQLAVENGCHYLVHDVEDEVVPDDFIKLLKKKKINTLSNIDCRRRIHQNFWRKN